MKLRTIRLLKKHRHAGKEYAVGDKLPPTNEQVAQWLVEHKVGEDVTDGEPNTITRTSTALAPTWVKRCCGQWSK